MNESTKEVQDIIWRRRCQLYERQKGFPSRGELIDRANKIRRKKK